MALVEEDWMTMARIAARCGAVGTVLLALCLVTLSAAQASTTNEALREVALDYALGWYTGDGERMARALHEDLAKRALLPGPDGQLRVDEMGKSRLVAMTLGQVGTSTPEHERIAEVEILDVYGRAAVVKLTMHGWVDYLQLIEQDGQWRIINVLWELKPKPKAETRPDE